MTAALFSDKKPSPTTSKRRRLYGKLSARPTPLDLRAFQDSMHQANVANPIIKTKGAFGKHSHAEIVRGRKERALLRFAKKAAARNKKGDR